MRTSRRRSNNQRGAALLAVLWLSAALTAIAFTLATTVRGETERTTTAVEGTKAYYLATGSLERAILHIEWGSGYRYPDGSPRFYEQGMTQMHFEYPTGVTDVEIIPEAAKLNINSSKPEEINSLLLNLGVNPERASLITAAIVDWRSNTGGDGPSPFDEYYLSQRPSFRPRHASFEEIEELLSVRGVTPDLFYGQYVRDDQGRLRATGGLRDCLSVYSSPAPIVDINSAEPAVLRTIGLSPEQVALVVNTRRIAPLRKPEEFAPLRAQLGAGGSRLRVGGSTIFTLRATARTRAGKGTLTDLRRSVAAVVKVFPPGWNMKYQVLRWYDNAWKSEDLARP